MLNVELEALGRLKDEDDGTAKPEAADFVSRAEGLTTEQLRGFGVGRFRVGAGGDGAERRVGAEGLVAPREKVS